MTAGSKKISVKRRRGRSRSVMLSDDRGGSWGDDGTIVFASGCYCRPYRKISSVGGTPQALITLDKQTGETHADAGPRCSPGGKAVLFTS